MSGRVNAYEAQSFICLRDKSDCILANLEPFQTPVALNKTSSASEVGELHSSMPAIGAERSVLDSSGFFPLQLCIPVSSCSWWGMILPPELSDCWLFRMDGILPKLQPVSFLRAASEMVACLRSVVMATELQFPEAVTLSKGGRECEGGCCMGCFGLFSV